MCVTGPQTQPGVVDEFATDLTDAVAHARDHRHETPQSGSMYGGAGANLSTEDRERMIDMISGYMDMITDGPPT